MGVAVEIPPQGGRRTNDLSSQASRPWFIVTDGERVYTGHPAIGFQRYEGLQPTFLNSIVKAERVAQELNEGFDWPTEEVGGQ